jgi:cobalamin-dependent methionine synthase I
VDEVLRYLGYPAQTPPNPRLQDVLDHWVVEANRRAEPRAVYQVLPVTQLRPRSLRLSTSDGEVEFRGAVGEFLGPSEFVVVFVATAGPNVERLASELMQQGDELAAMIVNAVGAERAEAAEAKILERLREQARHFGFSPTLPYSPGYCGMALSEQRTLFDLFGDFDVGVTLTDSCLMRPLKSVSGLIGLGPAQLVTESGSPCDRCEMYNCAMRR